MGTLSDADKAWLRSLNLTMGTQAREIVLRAYFWIDKDRSGALTESDLREFAISLDPRDDDVETTVRGMLFAMASGTAEERAAAVQVNRDEWMEFWDGPHLECLDEEKAMQIMKNFDMLVNV